jgi:hypothetical protein
VEVSAQGQIANLRNGQELVIDHVLGERDRQDEKWGPAPDTFLDRPDGTGEQLQVMQAEYAKRWCDDAFRAGLGNWALILNEEFREALAESDPDKLYAELIQVAAVAVAWAETIKARA